MSGRTLVILVLVLIAALAAMALGGGALRDRQEGTAPPASYDDPDAGLEAIDGATGWLRSGFSRNRIASDCWDGAAFRFPSACEVAIGPGSLRPSRFRLTPAGAGVSLCFAFDRGQLSRCVARVGDLQMKDLDRASDFTVARDSAFIVFRCAAPAGTGCVVTLTDG